MSEAVVADIHVSDFHAKHPKIESSTGEMASQLKLFVKKLGPNATLPQRQSALAAGYDLFRSVVPLIGAVSEKNQEHRLRVIVITKLVALHGLVFSNRSVASTRFRSAS